MIGGTSENQTSPPTSDAVSNKSELYTKQHFTTNKAYDLKYVAPPLI